MLQANGGAFSSMLSFKDTNDPIVLQDSVEDFREFPSPNRRGSYLSLYKFSVLQTGPIRCQDHIMDRAVCKGHKGLQGHIRIVRLYKVFSCCC